VNPEDLDSYRLSADDNERRFRERFLEVQQRLHRELPAEFGERLRTIDELARLLGNWSDEPL
jgi:hypothetical protein